MYISYFPPLWGALNLTSVCGKARGRWRREGGQDRSLGVVPPAHFQRFRTSENGHQVAIGQTISLGFWTRAAAEQRSGVQERLFGFGVLFCVQI